MNGKKVHSSLHRTSIPFVQPPVIRCQSSTSPNSLALETKVRIFVSRFRWALLDRMQRMQLSNSSTRGVNAGSPPSLFPPFSDDAACSRSTPFHLCAPTWNLVEVLRSRCDLRSKSEEIGGVEWDLQRPTDRFVGCFVPKRRRRDDLLRHVGLAARVDHPHGFQGDVGASGCSSTAEAATCGLAW